jgi:hypothetical protein
MTVIAIFFGARHGVGPPRRPAVIRSAAGISAKAFWRELYQLQGEGQALDITAVLQPAKHSRFWE